MKTILLIVLLLLIPSLGFGELKFFESLDTIDWILLTVSNLSLMADWGTTLDIARHPEKWSETNRLLGKHPSVGKVNTHFISSILINSAIIYALPNPYRKAWSSGVLIVEVYTVGKNLNAGLKIKF